MPGSIVKLKHPVDLYCVGPVLNVFSPNLSVIFSFAGVDVVKWASLASGQLADGHNYKSIVYAFLYIKLTMKLNKFTNHGVDLPVVARR
jgi:hypothetical protein